MKEGKVLLTVAGIVTVSSTIALGRIFSASCAFECRLDLEAGVRLIIVAARRRIAVSFNNVITNLHFERSSRSQSSEPRVEGTPSSLLMIWRKGGVVYG